MPGLTSPFISISSDKSRLSASETALLTFTLSEPISNFGAEDVTVLGGSMSQFVQSAADPRVYTATFTPAPQALSAAVFVASQSFSNAAGVLNEDGSESDNVVSMAIAPLGVATPPTIAISTPKNTLTPGEAVTVTFTLSENSNDFTAADVTTLGGSLSNLTGSGKVYTATFTPTAGARSAMLFVDSNRFTNASGQLNLDGADGNNAASFSINAAPVTPPPPPPQPPAPAAPVAPVVKLDTSSDSGLLGDQLTNDSTPTLSGTGTAGDVVTIKNPAGAVIGTATVAANGSWRITPAAALPEGLNTLSVTASNASGQTSTPVSLPLTIDSAAPTVAISTPKTVLTAGETVTVSFTLSDNSSDFSLADVTALGGSLSNWVGSGKVYTATFTPTTGARSAMVFVDSARFSDAAGNFNKDGADGNNVASFSINAAPVTPPPPPPQPPAPAAPVAPVVKLDTSSDSGSVGDQLTNDSTPTLSGTGTAGDVVTVKNAAGAVIGTATVAANGSWRITPAAALPEGLNTLSVTASNASGQTSTPVSLPITIDSLPPTVVISTPKTVLAAGEAVTVSFTLSDNSSDFSLTDVTVLGGSLSNLVGSGKVYTATFTPTAGARSAMLFVDSDRFSDAAGNFNKDGADSNNVASFSIQPPAVAPSAPLAALAASSDSGLLGDKLTNDSTPTISGTGTAGYVITVKDAAGLVIGTATVAANGSWSITPANALPSGLNALSVTATNAAGLTSAATTLAITIDNTASAVPAANLDASSDSGVLGDKLTKDTTPTISGTGTAGEVITVKDGSGAMIGTATVAANGTWSITPVTALPSGANTLSVTSTDAAGNTSAATPLVITIDNTASAAPVANLDASSDSGVLGDKLTNDTTPTISGTGTAGEVITVKDASGAVIGTATVAANGTWSITPVTALPSGANTLSVTSTDAAGNTSAATPLVVTIDNTASAAPVANLDVSSDSGVLGDKLTNDTTPTISGTGTAGEVITVKDASGAVIGTATVAANGTWSITPASPLPSGANTFNVTTTDAAGNISAATPLVITVDNTASAAPVANLDASSDSGTLGDRLTNDTTPTISGTGTAGEVITVKDAAGAVIGTATISANGTWSITPATALPTGVNTFSVTITDAAGNTSATTPIIITIDTTASAAPVANLDASSDSGVLGDKLTNDTTPTLSGTGTAGEVITLKDASGAVIGTATVAANGTWSITPVTALPSGANTLSVTSTDAAGNTSAATPLVVTIDNTASAAPVANLDASSDSGVLGDKLTNDTTPTISGTGTPGEVITVKDASGAVIGTATVTANSTWSITPVTALPSGANTLSITSTDAAGNTSPATPLVVTIDNTASGAPVANLDASSDSGVLGDKLTNDTTPTISGTGTAGEVITVKDASGAVIGTATVAANGTWSITPTTALPSGANTLSVTSTDAAGNTSAATPLVITIDTSTPAAPTTPSAPTANLAASSDSGVLGDKLTNDTTPTISGTGSAGDVITIKDAANAVIGTATVAPDGTWSITPTTALPSGANTLSVTATNASAQTSPATPLVITIDNTASAAPTATLDPSSDSGVQGDKVTNDTTPTISGTGTAGEVITVKDASGATIGTATVAANGTWSITPTTALPSGANTLSITSTDAAGNNSTATPLAITIDTSASAAPVANLDASSDSGVLGDKLTNDTTPTISGTGNAGEVITVKDASGAVIGTATVAANGSWSITPATALPSGANTLSVTSTDAAGNTSAATPLVVTVDTSTPIPPSTPSAPTANLAASSDSGVLGDKLTNDTTPTISGTGTAGEVITIKDAANAVIGTATVAPDGSWSITPATALPSGANTLSVTSTDAAGNNSTATPLAITIDTSASAAPTATLDPSSDSGVPGDKLTSDTTPTISGTGTAGEVISIKDATNAVIGTTTVAVDGSWSITPTTALPSGANTFNVTTTDAAGNTSAATPLVITIDTSTPAAPSTPSAPPANLDVSSDSGVLGDKLTNDTTPTISGTGTAGDVITIKDAANAVIGTATVAANGTWSITPTTALPSGANTLSVTATNASAQTSPATPLVITIDNTASAAPVANLDASSDSGVLGDKLTNDTTPTISGTGTAGEVITIKDAANAVIGTATVAPDGSWSITPATALPSGANTLSVTSTDAAGNNSTATPLAITIDTSASAAPTATLDPSSDSGVPGDKLTSDTTPTISGTGTAGEVISIKDATNAVIGTTTVAVDGSWSITPTTALPSGANTFNVTTTDAAGNTSAATPLVITIDTSTPAAPSTPSAPPANLDVSSDSGVLGDKLTNDTTPTISGTGTAGDVITIKDAANAVIGTATVAANGTWSITPTTALPSGANTLSVTATNASAQTSPATPLVITIDNTAAAAPTATLDTSSDSGTLGDKLTNDTTPTISGTGTAGDVITIKDAANAVVGTATVATDGSWSITPTTALPSGANTLSVTATNASAQTSPATPLVVTIDNTASAAPTATLDPSSDSGVQGDKSTEDTTPTLSGTGTAGEVITLKDAANAVIGTATVAPDGTWSITPATALPTGANTFSVTTTDAAGNTSAATPLTVTITSPVLGNASITGTATGAVTEDASTAIVSGSLTVTDPDTGENMLQTPASLAGVYGTFTLDTTTGAWTYTLDNSRAATQALAGQATVTEKLTVTSKDGSVSQDISVLITGTDDAPVLSIPSAGPPGTAKSPVNNTVVVANNTVVAGLWDPIVDMYGTPDGLGSYHTPYYAYGGTTPMVVRDDNNMAGTTNTRLDQGDILAADFQGYNGVVYGVALGLRKIKADGLGAATLRVDIKKPDGTIISGVVTASSTRQGGAGGWDSAGYNLGSTIGNFTADQTGTYTMLIVGTSVAPVRLNFPEAKVINAAGEVIVNPVHLSYTEGQGMAAINTAVTVADVDNTSAVSAKVAITGGFAAAEDVLGFVNDGQTMGNITASLSPGVVRLSSAGGTATLAQWQSALRAVQYSNTSDKPSTATRTVQYTLNDGTLDSAVATSLIGVTPVKDAPVLTDTSLSLAMVAADAPVPTGAVGTLVSSLMGGVSLPDGTTTLKGMAITGVDTSQGTLFFSTNGGTTWTAVSSVSDANALLLKSDADNRLYFQPAAGVSNSIASAVTFRAWDQRVGTEGAYVDVSVNGGTSSYSSATDVLLQKLPVVVNLSDVAQGSGGFVINGDSASDRSGYALSNAGDVNGDGLDDILVGAVGADVNGAADAGRAYVVYGKAGSMQIDLSAVAAGVGGFAIEGFAVNDAVGNSVSAAGDVNHDGLADLVVISSNGNATPSGNNQGRAHVIFGSTSGTTVHVNALAASSGFSINGVTDASSVGLQTVSAAGDVNGDGLEDFVVGTFTADVAGMSDAGKAYVVFGRSNNSTDIELSAVAAGCGGFVVQGQSASDVLGTSVSNAGDVNGDGLADLIVGATLANGTGAAYVVLGQTGGGAVSVSALGAQGFVIFGECAGDQAGRVSSAGDVNGDGLADLIVGASGSDLSNGANAGRSYVVFGRTGAVTDVQLSAIAAGSGGFVINGQCAGDAAGAVGYAGDVNGDGLADLMVGASAADPAAGTDAGRAYVVYGKTSTSAVQLSSLALGEGGFFINGQSAGDMAGNVSLGGDINGDGFADVLVGAASATTAGGTLAGKSYVVWGGSRFMDTLDVSGQQAADTLSGSALSDTFVAGDGADVLTGNGGADVMYGGKGNDTFVLNASNVQALHSPMGQGGNVLQLARVDGGTGYDTLQLSEGAALNLGAVSHADAASPDVASRIEGIERFDLASDAASNTLGLSASDLAELASFNSVHTGSASADGKTWTNVSGTALGSVTPYHQLVVEGDAQDALNLQAGQGSWAKVGTVNDGLHDHLVYQNEALHAQVIVRQGMAVYGADTVGNPANAAPVLTDRILNLDTLGDVPLDPAGEVGNLVSQFMGGVSDANGASALQGMAITGVDTSRGSLYYSTNGGLSWAQVSAVSDHMALLLGAGSNNRIYFKPNAGVTDNINSAVSFRAWDQTLGTEGVYVDVLAGAGLTPTSAFSSSTEQIAQNFVPKVNLAAVAQGFGGFVINGQCAGDVSGFSVANAGDVNGDGYDDLIVGAPYADTSVTNSGRAFVVFGKSGTSAINLSGLAAASAGFVLEGFGTTFSAASVAAAGDVNGDGLADLIAGAHNEDGTHGRTYIVYGKTSSSTVLASAVNAGSGGYTIIGFTSSGQLFSAGALSAAGDVNGDGLTDFLIGAAKGQSVPSGKTYVVFGSTDMAKVQLTAVQAGSGGFAINAQSSGDYTGYSVSNAGDVNGDGLADVVLGTYNSDPAAGTDAGRSYVVFGKTSTSGVNLSALQAGSGGFVIQGQCASDLSGFSVSQAGDVNGDGLGDVVVFAPQADPGARANAGSTYVVYGKTDGQVIQLSAIAAGVGGYVINGQSAGDGVYLTTETQVPQRTRVSYAGDINGDGLADLIIGSQLADPATGVDAGCSYLVYGRTTNTPIELSDVVNGIGGFVINGQSAGDNAGIVSMAGDINGDGFDDLLVGARTADPAAGADAGKTYVIFGGSQWDSQVDLLGDAAANTLTGNALSETFVAGDGHDRLIGNGGADVMYGGKGDDTFVLNASNVSALQSPLGAGGNVGQLARVIGGTGYDTLALSAGASLNLQSVSNADGASPDGMSRIESIERIDLASDTAANTLGLSAQDVVDMAGFNSIHTGTLSADGKTWTNVSGTALADSTRYHQLVVEGDAADVLNLQLGTGLWTNTGTVNDGTHDYTVYQNEGMRSQVIVRTGLTVNNLDSVAPVVLDMNRDGILSYSQVQMDVNGDGLLDQTAWAAPQDGVLVWDKYADAMVHDHSQFAFSQYAGLLGTGATDLQGLAAAFDSNGDGQLNLQDAHFAEMAVWQDANHNGVSDSGEVRHLLDVGIVSLQLHSDGVLRAPAPGVQEAGRTSATLLDGSQLLVADAAFAYNSGSALQWHDVLAPADRPEALYTGNLLPTPNLDTSHQLLIDQAQLMTH
ncbi:hypothetical protein B9Z51_17015 [Limnohabitans sp. T6-5]|uniref:Ig-like domain-containing protein n=1 Tax=Limnohabitans sp. T6-5 TaxID=1100724 RepID=UPI000D355F57|nr:Ig-like domain-containing protein [Limnohabitans sp. T6-5]PUE05953.1 hypothetical protein B9Z51_17015 [Limnohabitans sp. T6-5]